MAIGLATFQVVEANRGSKRWVQLGSRGCVSQNRFHREDPSVRAGQRCVRGGRPGAEAAVSWATTAADDDAKDLVVRGSATAGISQ